MNQRRVRCCRPGFWSVSWLIRSCRRALRLLSRSTRSCSRRCSSAQPGDLCVRPSCVGDVFEQRRRPVGFAVGDPARSPSAHRTFRDLLRSACRSAHAHRRRTAADVHGTDCRSRACRKGSSSRPRPRRCTVRSEKHLRELADVVDPAAWDDVGPEELVSGNGNARPRRRACARAWASRKRTNLAKSSTMSTCFVGSRGKKGSLLVAHARRLRIEQLRLPRRTEKARPRIADDAEHEPAVVAMDISALVAGQLAEHRYAIPERTAVGSFPRLRPPSGWDPRTASGPVPLERAST